MSIPLNFKKPTQPTQPAATAPVAEPPTLQDRTASAVALNAAVQAFNAETIPVLDRLTASIDRLNAASREREEAYASIDDDETASFLLRWAREEREARASRMVETAARLHRDLLANKPVRLDADGLRTLADLAVTLNQAVMLNQALARMGASGSAGA
ncbi:hypothetical protein [Burkholderia sp. Ax-1724]|uniref:hypothetical protein n=1 Tax=Burkholderia sp. Ax-1724 TaxID=2608336 RepID=UPI00141E757B|nr:hypothetical protein [Burkholderia sp. Ax-1724]NIF54983.1 hypothetical protein [Burkholderia sp. Ax-1724]